MIFHLTGDLNEDTGILGTKGRRVGKQKKDDDLSGFLLKAQR